MLPSHLGVVGLGLMGASLAPAVRRVDPGVAITAVEPSEEIRTRALADGVVDAATAELCEIDYEVLHRVERLPGILLRAGGLLVGKDHLPQSGLVPSAEPE